MSKKQPQNVISDLKMAADGCGEIARGFKKLRAFLSSETMISLFGTKSPEKGSESSEKGSESSEIGSESSDRYQKEFLEAEVVEKWAISRESGWGCFFSLNLAEFIVGNRWRGDNLKNY